MVCYVRRVEGEMNMTTVEWQQKDRAMREWQRNVMGNHCTICWNHNGWTQCDACGWWGYCPPEPVIKLTTPVSAASPDRGV